MKINRNALPEQAYANTPFEHTPDATAALKSQGLSDLYSLPQEPANYIPKSVTPAYSAFEKVYRAWKNPPEDYAQLSKTAAGKKLAVKLYDAAKELDVTETEVFDLFKEKFDAEHTNLYNNKKTTPNNK